MFAWGDLVRNILKHGARALFIALAGAGMASMAHAADPPFEAPVVLEFGFAGDDKICGGYDAARNRLGVDRCTKIAADEAAALSYFSDSTLRSRKTGQCLTREQATQTEPAFQACESGSEFQKFTFKDKGIARAGAWPALAPAAGPVSGGALGLDNACLITGWPQRTGETDPAGVYLWSCHADWEYSPNKVVTARPLVQPMVLEFAFEGGDKICGGYDAATSKLVVDRCDRINADASSVLAYHLADSTIRGGSARHCLTREQSTNTEPTFQPCTAGSDFQRFAFQPQREGWPALVPAAGPVSGLAAERRNACLVTNRHQGTAQPGPFVVILWSCHADWEYTPNKAVKMQAVADCARNQAGPDGKCAVVEPPKLDEPLNYADVSLKLFKNNVDTQTCAVARMGFVGEWVRAGDCLGTETTAGKERRLSTFTLAIFDSGTSAIVELMSTVDRSPDGLCVAAEWNADFSAAAARRRVCDHGDAQRWIVKLAPGSRRYQIQPLFTPPGKASLCLDVGREDVVPTGQILGLRECSAPDPATWELANPY